jgi:antitoxin component of MazEF toxin-antitoxin module
MQEQGKIQKWGNSSAIRLSAKLLAAAGITTDSEVDIQANDGRVVIQLHEQT